MTAPKPPATLRARFEAFVKTLEGFEDIDTLLKSRDVPGKKRADYLFQNRSIIVEQKSLEIDPADKPQKFVEQLIKEGKLMFWGALSTEAIFRRMPNGDDLREQLALKIGKVVSDNVEYADKQFRDTREIFNIPGAGSILVILNEDATTLYPDIVTYALTNTFQKKVEDEYRYRNADGVLLISEAHPVETPGFQKSFPIQPYVAPATENSSDVSAFMKMMATRWAQFNGAAFIRARAGASKS
ncbi:MULTISPECIES: hypothetical protein [unclassified Novosphingobium]|uniref:hypothetical protein n=1 Tax=unclassified Novosphingobium TaxID=2644732 RepID=UPI00146C3AA1|nr:MULTISPECIES: hypothetical protein [unclassified Novosphingobium]NMN07271.1 hypothetical protein [Novosphingobium sp. SG919]NMN89578.1 hypothetical protein [Novosphingobium sp. SG916]